MSKSNRLTGDTSGRPGTTEVRRGHRVLFNKVAFPTQKVHHLTALGRQKSDLKWKNFFLFTRLATTKTLVRTHSVSRMFGNPRKCGDTLAAVSCPKVSQISRRQRGDSERRLTPERHTRLTLRESSTQRTQIPVGAGSVRASSATMARIFARNVGRLSPRISAACDCIPLEIFIA